MDDKKNMVWVHSKGSGRYDFELFPIGGGGDGVWVKGLSAAEVAHRIVARGAGGVDIRSYDADDVPLDTLHPEVLAEVQKAEPAWTSYDAGICLTCRGTGNVDGVTCLCRRPWSGED